MFEGSTLRRHLHSACSYLAITTAALALAVAHAQGDLPAPSADDGAEVVTVTAQRRAQDLQEVPSSVTAFTAALREETGIISAQDQLNFTPGVTYSPGFDRVTVRGIGRVTTQLGTDAGVAVYQDGFYVGSATNIGNSTLLTERVEVLRGPQGTLYGRNSVGGAINAISRRPGDEFAFDARTSINNYGGVRVETRVASPIAEGLSASFTLGAVNQEEGYYKNSSNSLDEGGVEDSWNADLQLQYEAEDFDVWLRYTTLESTTHPRNATGISRYGVNPDGTPVTKPALLRGTGAPYVFYGLGADDNPGYFDNRAFRADRQTTATYDNYHQVIGELIWHAEDFDIKYIGGYRTYDYLLEQDGNATDNTDFLFPYDCAALLAPGGTTGGYYRSLTIDQIEDCDVATPGTQRQYRRVHNDITRDSTDDRTEYSHEINITSTGDGPFQYILGAYYFHSEQNQYFDISSRNESGNNIILGARPNPSPDKSFIYYFDADLETTSKALYGQIDYEFSDELKATVGLRYSKDEKEGYEENLLVAWLVTGVPAGLPDGSGGVTTFRPLEIVPGVCPAAGSSNPDVPPFFPVDPNFPCPIARNLTGEWDAVTGTAGIEWTPTDDRLVYVRYSRGYKSGGFNLGTVLENPFVDSEFVNAYEAGWKEKVSDTLQFNSAVFYYDYIDQQTPASEEQVRGDAQVAVSYLINLPEVETYGAEVELTWEPVENLRILANYSYLHTEVIRDTCNDDGSGCIGDPSDPLAEQPGAKPVRDVVFNGGVIQRLQSITGNTLPGSPEHKVALNATYRMEFDEGEFIASATWNWRDDSYYTLFNNPLHLVEGGDSTDIRLSWRDAESGVTVIGTVENVFDDDVSTGLFTDTPSNLSFQSLFLEPPRIYTLEVQYSF